jgi:hypothetical protein
MTHNAETHWCNPASRVPCGIYLDLRTWLIANDPDAGRIRDWAAALSGLPTTAEDMAAEVIWIILCAGRSAQSARTIERKVILAIKEGRPVVTVFGYRAKAAAIERAWSERDHDYGVLRTLEGNHEGILQWCGLIPFVGNDTKYQLAKNFGANVCKPDIWLCRLSGFPDRPRRQIRERFAGCMALCRYLSESSGDSIPVIDSLLWLACNKGILTVSPDAGAIAFRPGPLRTRSIYE